jgi:hypothetical protein
MEEGRKTFWNNRRRDLVAKASINLFQALFLALFISEAFSKASVWLKTGFVVALIASFVASVFVCPEKGGD